MTVDGPNNTPGYHLAVSGRRSSLMVAGGFAVLTALAAVSTIGGYADAVRIDARGQFALTFASAFGLASVMWYL